jgi:hypothetical protein
MPRRLGRTPTGSGVQHSESITVKLGVPLYPNSVNNPPPPNQFVYHVYLVHAPCNLCIFSFRKLNHGGSLLHALILSLCLNDPSASLTIYFWLPRARHQMRQMKTGRGSSYVRSENNHDSLSHQTSQGVELKGSVTLTEHNDNTPELSSVT